MTRGKRTTVTLTPREVAAINTASFAHPELSSVRDKLRTAAPSNEPVTRAPKARRQPTMAEWERELMKATFTRRVPRPRLHRG